MVTPNNVIREAIAVACETLTGDLYEWVLKHEVAMRDHVLIWVRAYGASRGVELTDEIITSELKAIVCHMKNGGGLRDNLDEVVVVPLPEVEELMTIPRTLFNSVAQQG